MENIIKNKQTKKWVKTWQRAGAALNEIKQRELRAYDYNENRKIIDEMLQWAHDHRDIRLTSGLVKQQRLFMKIKNKEKQLDIEYIFKYLTPLSEIKESPEILDNLHNILKS